MSSVIAVAFQFNASEAVRNLSTSKSRSSTAFQIVAKRDAEETWNSFFSAECQLLKPWLWQSARARIAWAPAMVSEAGRVVATTF